MAFRFRKRREEECYRCMKTMKPLVSAAFGTFDTPSENAECYSLLKVIRSAMALWYPGRWHSRKGYNWQCHGTPEKLLPMEAIALLLVLF